MALGVDCGRCNMGEVMLFTRPNGSLVEHTSRPGFFKSYCDSCGVIGGIDRDKNPAIFHAMNLGKVEKPAVFIAAPARGARRRR